MKIANMNRLILNETVKIICKSENKCSLSYFCYVLVEIVQIIDESHRVKRFVLKSLDGSIFNFLPGQFITLFRKDLPEFENTRSYSISSLPGLNYLELCIALNEKGIFTPWLFQLSVGQTLEISEPQGQFVYKEEHANFSNIFICTGTGIAPFLSMIDRALKLGANSVHLVFGNRIIQDQLFQNHIESWRKQYPQFHFYPVFSRETYAEYTGYVHPVYEGILKDIGSEARIFVCGWKDMCVETRQNLKNMGYNRKQYFFEQYD